VESRHKPRPLGLGYLTSESVPRTPSVHALSERVILGALVNISDNNRSPAELDKFMLVCFHAT